MHWILGCLTQRLCKNMLFGVIHLTFGCSQYAPCGIGIGDHCCVSLITVTHDKLVLENLRPESGLKEASCVTSKGFSTCYPQH